MFTGQFVEVGLEFARGKLLARFDLLTPLPPVRITVVEYVLGGGVSLTEVGLFLLTISGYGLTFFLTAFCSSVSDGSVDSSPSPHSDETCSIFSCSAALLICASENGPRFKR